MRDPTVFVHERGLCESDDVGARTRVWAFAHVMKGAHVGADCNVGDHAFIETGAWVGNRVTVKNAVLVWDRVTVEDDVFLGPNMVFTNERMPRAAFRKPEALRATRVCAGASVGANATVVCGITLGPHCFIGAGAVVTRDVPAHALMVGNPAARVGWVCACGEKLGRDLLCAACGRNHRLVDEPTGLTVI